VRRCARWPKKWAATEAKGRCKCGQSTNLNALRSKIRCETNNRRRLQEKVWILAWPLDFHEFLAKKFITKMATCDFWVFPKLKVALKRRFAGIPYIPHNMTLLRGIPENNFQDCFQ
jgi:hypothetical protein